MPLFQSQARRAHRAARHEDANLVMISQNYNTTAIHQFSARRNYVEVVTRKPKKRRMPDQNNASVTTSSLLFMQMAMEKGRLVKVCANPDCKVHFGNRQREESSAFNSKRKRKLQTGK